jgi:integrase
MASLELMTWSKADKRWHKGYRARRFAVSPKQLKCPATKEASRTAANDWWTAKQKEIDEALGKAKQHPAHIVKRYELAIRNHRVYAWWHRREGKIEEATKSEAAIEWLQEALQSDTPPLIDEWAYSPWGEPSEVVEGGIPFDQFSDILQWRERIAEWERQQQAETAAPKEDTIRAHVDDYLATRKAQAEVTGKISTYESQQYHLPKFRQWVEPLAGIATLNETLWERFCLHLSKQVKDGKIAPATRRGTQAVAREFIIDRWQKRYIELPRNLNNRNLSAKVPLQDVTVFSKEEITKLMGIASDRKRLYLLMMLGCGMYPVDIATLRQDEVDWTEGRITRQRTKTKGKGNVPKVDYLLWRETFALLKRFRATDGELALLNTNGKPLWKWVEKDGKRCKVSNVATAYYQLLKDIPKEQRKPLKALRATGASMLENHAEYGRYAQYFLGHAPRSIADKHYVKPSGDQFDKAILWLGRQFGMK